MRRSNRNLANRLLVLAVVAVAGQPGVAVAQGVSEPGGPSTRGPRFLVASAEHADPVRVDVKSVPTLRRTLSLQLEQTRLGDALAAISQQAGLDLIYADDVVPADARVTLRAETITVAAALTHVLLDAGVDVVFTRNGVGRIVRQPPLEPLPLVGVITGRVTDARSGAAVSGANVAVEGTGLDAVTSNTGRYEIADVPAGTHTVVVQQLGYAEVGISVQVTNGGEAIVDFALVISALPMDEIVATGTAFETRMRTVPNPINVITAQEIETKGSSNITDLLRGEIPGVMALSGGQDDYFSQVYVRGNASWTTDGYIKTYIDGVAVANPTYLSTIDPKSIDRIEVVRGPQASAIYGSEALSGVLQIFTKKGRPDLDRPRLDVQASVGMIESDYTPSSVSRPPTQSHSLGVSGGRESFSYRAGASYGTVGEWLTGYGSSTFGFSSGLRVVQGPFTAELTALWSDRGFGYANSPLYRRWPQGPDCRHCGQPDLVYPNYDLALSQNTTGLTIGYRATEHWQHTLTLGDDQNRFALHQPEAHHLTPADTFVLLQNRETRRRSIRYHTAYDAELGKSVTGRFTAGVDYWSYDVQGSNGADLLNAFGTVRTSPNTSATFYNDSWWNAGYFGMAELGFSDRLFVTLATRLEDNPHLGEEYGRAISPRIGASYARALGPVEVKLRAQWGKGVSPPPDFVRTGLVTSSAIYLANAEVGPEEKAGWDAGVDVYWGSRGSLSLTRYAEEGRNLIQWTDVDLTAESTIRQYQNIGRVGSEGWEVEGKLNLGLVTLRANYAYSDNVIRDLSNQYTANPSSTYQIGDRMRYMPTHSGGATATWHFWRGIASVNASVIDEWWGLDYIAYYGSIYGGEPSRGAIREYYVTYSDALWKWNLRVEQALTEHWTTFAQVDNLSNNQAADVHNLNVTPGRSTVVGVRWTH